MPGRVSRSRDHVVILDRVVRLRDLDPLSAARRTRSRHVVAAGEVVEARDHREATGVDLGDVRHARGVGPEIDAEDAGGAVSIAWIARVQMSTTPGSTTEARQARRRRHAARLAAAAEVGQPLARLHQHELAVAPQRLRVEVPARQVLGQREGVHGHAAHLRPVLDPRPRLGGPEPPGWRRASRCRRGCGTTVAPVRRTPRRSARGRRGRGSARCAERARRARAGPAWPGTCPGRRRSREPSA